MIHEVTFARPDFGIGERFVDFERTGLNPFAILVIAALLGDFADVDFGVEVGGESLAVIAGVAVDDVEVVHLLEVMLGGIGSVDAAHTWVEAAAQNGCQTSLLEAFAVGPLPAVLEVSLVAWLVVGGVEVVHAALQAGLHDGEVLIGQGEVDDQVWFVTVEQGHEFVDAVGIDLVGGDIGFANGLGHGIAFALGA